MSNFNIDDEQTKEIVVNPKKNKSVVAGEEVELNDYDKSEIVDKQKLDENKTKALIMKKIIIGVICIVAVICCVIVYFAFIANNENNTEEAIEDENSLLTEDKETYEGLNYDLEKETLQEIGFFYDYSRNLEGSKILVSYLKINGLKDKGLQDSVNELLKSNAEELFNEADVQDAKVLYSHIYNYTDVYIFNNVLSTLYCKETCDIDGNVQYQYKGINLNLNDLSNIKIEDVFIKSTNLENIMTDNMKKMYLSDNFQYSVSPMYVYIPIEDGTVEKISLYDNKDKVAIYKRFNKNKKLFDKTYNAVQYAYTTKKLEEADLYGFVEDNLFIDTYNNSIQLDYNENILQAKKKLYMDACNKIRNISYNNPSKRYLVQIVPSVQKSNTNEYTITVKYTIYEIDKEFYDKSIVNFVVETENKRTKEYEIAEYFKNPVMDAQEYLVNETTDTLTMKVDENGAEISSDIYLLNQGES